MFLPSRYYEGWSGTWYCGRITCGQRKSVIVKDRVVGDIILCNLWMEWSILTQNENENTQWSCPNVGEKNQHVGWKHIFVLFTVYCNFLKILYEKKTTLKCVLKFHLECSTDQCWRCQTGVFMLSYKLNERRAKHWSRICTNQISPWMWRHRNQTTISFLLFLLQVEKHVYHKASVIDMHF